MDGTDYAKLSSSSENTPFSRTNASISLELPLKLEGEEDDFPLEKSITNNTNTNTNVELGLSHSNKIPETIVGGAPGHVFRRLWHIFLFITLPLSYYLVGTLVLDGNFSWPRRIVSACCLVYLILEIVRLTLGWTCFGMRSYEASRISGNAWGVVSLSMVFLLAPTDWGTHPGSIGIPLVWSLALGDPVLGEARRFNWSQTWVLGSGLLVVFMVWISCVFWLGTPWYLVPICVPLIVACELPKLSWIDDNAVMLLVPLACLLILQPWID